MTEHESGAARGTALTRRLMALWDAPPADPAAANAAFAELYTDPVMINGAAVSISDLVSMAHGLSGVYADARHEVTDVVEGRTGSPSRSPSAAGTSARCPPRWAWSPRPAGRSPSG